MLGSLSQMGYSAAWGIVSAADVGAPHIRKRLWIVAYDYKNNISTAFEESPKQRKTIDNCKVVNSDNCEKRIQGQCEKKIQRFERLPWGENIGKIEDFYKRSDIPEPLICRMAYGNPDYVERLAAIGDGQVPTVAAFAFEYLRAVIERQ